MRSLMRHRERDSIRIQAFRGFIRKCLLQKSIEALLTHAFSDRQQKKRLARLHYRHKLASLMWAGISKSAYLHKTCKVLQARRATVCAKKHLNVWYSQYLGTQVNKEAFIFLLRKRLQTILKQWHVIAKTHLSDKSSLARAASY